MIAAVIPAGVGAQDALWMSIPKRYELDGRRVVAKIQDLTTIFYAQAFFNSLVFDWVMRGSIAIHMNKTYICEADAAAIRNGNYGRAQFSPAGAKLAAPFGFL